MSRWREGATEFNVSVIPNVRCGTSYSYIPKPILGMLGNPSGLKFIIRGEDIIVDSRD